MSHNQSELDNDTVLMHKIDEILYGEHEKPYSTGDALLMLIRNQIAQHESSARIDELENRLRVQFIPSHWARLCAEVNSWAKYVDRRIAELKAQQEEV